MKIVLIGPPGSGKGTQAELMSKKMNFFLISPGNIFRWHIKNKTELGEKIKKVIEKGELVSDEIVNQIIKKEIETKENYILDGYPRNLNQAKFLDLITEIDYVLEIWISDQEALKRLTLRRVCQCGKTYHLIYNPPKKDEICDECKRKLFIRDDDKKENVIKRLKIYHQETEPLLDYYQKESTVIKINGQQPIQDVFEEIIKKINLIKTKKEIEKMKKGGKILSEILKTLKREVKPGVSTKKIEFLARDLIKKFKAKPAFLGYKNEKHQKPFPTALCLSLNHELVHTPSLPERIIKDKDLVTIDCGIEFENYFTDSAISFGVGNISPLAKKLIKVTEKALYLAIKKIKPGIFWGDVASSIQKFVEKNGFSVVRDLTGHGVGRKLHEEPSLPNFGQPKTGIKLEENMTLAIEPMVTAGSHKIEILSDNWTVVTKDRSLSAHFEHTIAILKNKAEILTL
jgi:methionyl aminopeptidase